MEPQVSANDCFLLKTYRLERLQNFFPNLLATCILNLNSGTTLTIDCPEPRFVDELLDSFDRLRHIVWIVTGAQQISIRFAKEEVYRSATRRSQQRSLHIHTR